MKATRDLLTESIPRTLLRFSAPFVLTAFAAMAYGLVDMMWIGRINAEAVAAVGLVALLIWFGDALSLIGKNGMGVLVARYYGRAQSQEGTTQSEVRAGLLRRLGAGFQLSLFIALAFCLMAQLLLVPFAKSYRLGALVYQDLLTYGRIVLVGKIFGMMGVSYSQAYSSLGNSMVPFLINLVGLAFNMVLDPLLIFGLGFFPAMGVAGAAWATSLSQLLVWFLLFIYSRSRKPRDLLHLIGRASLRRPIDRSLYRQMLKIGLPMALMSLILCLISMVTNRLLARFGAVAVAVGALGAQIESISWMTTEGLGSALTSMVAQNIGAGHRKRVRDTVLVGGGISLAIGLFASLLFVLWGPNIFAIFMREEEAIRIGAGYLLIFAVQEPFMGLESASTATYAALGDTLFPSIVSLITNIGRVPGALFLMRYFGVYGVWIAMSGMGVLRSAMILVGLVGKLRTYLKTGYLATQA